MICTPAHVPAIFTVAPALAALTAFCTALASVLE
jgi:hypothetical protein